MYCQHCDSRTNETTVRPRRTRRSRTLTCERCGAPIVAAGGTSAAAGSAGGTGAQLERFGLAVTGDPLLESKREDT